MPAATAPQPTQAPTSNPPMPKAGPAIAAVNMPAAPSIDSKPSDPPSGVGDMFDKYAKPMEEAVVHRNDTPKPAEKKEAAKPEAEKPSTEPESGESPAPKADDKSEVKSDAKPDTKGEPTKKPSPWKLYEGEKERANKAEAEVASLRKLVGNEQERKSEMERLTKAEAKAKELEDHLRFVDYQKHPEFHDKYQKPYDDAWNRVMRRLAGVKVATADGARAVDVKDIMELGGLPADVVIEKAEEKFGKLGPWVAERVEEIKQLYESKAEALEKAKTEGIQKLKDDEDRSQRERKELGDYLNETWEKAHKELAEHSTHAEYFKAKEGDDEYNAILEKGKAFVQKAWLESPMEKGLTKEEREVRVKRQAKFQKFAEGFGAQRLVINRLKAENEQLKTDLAQFKGSEPKTEGQRPETTNGVRPGYDMDAFEQALMARSKPGVLG